MKTRLMLVHCVRPYSWANTFSDQEHLKFLLNVGVEEHGKELLDILQVYANNHYGKDTEILSVSDLG